uniref:Uncharacterized protein n=1 Tax=Rhizophora mucronata TaxID=61149 RepID=A0A2P2PES0_RHIMU
MVCPVFQPIWLAEILLSWMKLLCKQPQTQ